MHDAFEEQGDADLNLLRCRRVNLVLGWHMYALSLSGSFFTFSDRALRNPI
jgi:hypothetical protein